VWPKRLILLPAMVLLLFLGMYSWNQRTGLLDSLGSNTGLELVGVALRSTDYVRDTLSGLWYRYLDLVNVREENDRLRQQMVRLRNRLILAAEERAELRRLRRLLLLTPPEGWTVSAARVIGGRMSSNAVMNTIIIDRGYLTGAVPDTPVVTDAGVVGRIVRSGPTVSNVLLLSDPGSRIAVVSQESRIQGLLAGGGVDRTLKLMYASQNQTMQPREILVTSGLDGIYPKGIPVAWLSEAGPPGATPSSGMQFLPMIDVGRLEEVLLLERPFAPDMEIPAMDTFAGPFVPSSPAGREQDRQTPRLEGGAEQP
jgi:rod shape-determining protein MreC